MTIRLERDAAVQALPGFPVAFFVRRFGPAAGASGAGRRLSMRGWCWLHAGAHNPGYVGSIPTPATRLSSVGTACECPEKPPVALEAGIEVILGTVRADRPFAGAWPRNAVELMPEVGLGHDANRKRLRSPVGCFSTVLGIRDFAGWREPRTLERQRMTHCKDFRWLPTDRRPAGFARSLTRLSGETSNEYTDRQIL